MYKIVIRPLLFLFNPEKAHHITFFLLKIFSKIPLFQFITKKIFVVDNRRLEKEVFGLKFKNPVGLAAGLDKNAVAFNQFANFGFSFIEVGTITPKPQPGNPKPRLFRLLKDKALINRMGFNNNGLTEIIDNLKKNKHNVIIGGNIGKNTTTPNEQAPNDYIACFEGLYDYVDYFVVNVSCPNISNLSKLQDKDTLLKILSGITSRRDNKKTKKPVLLKISPDLNFQQIDDVLEVIQNTGCDGVVAVNTTISRTGLTYNEEYISQLGNGGLSGVPLKDRSTEIIRYINTKTNGKLPVIGVGGIMSAEDAMEKIKAGASLIQIYTGFIYEGPGLVKSIIKKYENTFN